MLYQIFLISYKYAAQMSLNEIAKVYTKILLVKYK